jgi:hypothetical protein
MKKSKKDVTELLSLNAIPSKKAGVPENDQHTKLADEVYFAYEAAADAERSPTSEAPLAFGW